MFPGHALGRRAPRLRPTTRDRAPARVGSSDPDGDERDDGDVVRNPETGPDALGRLALDSRQPGGESLVDRGEEEHHQGRAGVDVPERDRPLDLLTVDELVLLPVALVVVRLARAHEDVDGRAFEPGLSILRSRPSRLAHDSRGLGPALVSHDDEKPLPLAVPGT